MPKFRPSTSQSLPEHVLSDIGILLENGEMKPDKKQQLDKLRKARSEDKQNLTFRQPRNRKVDNSDIVNIADLVQFISNTEMLQHVNLGHNKKTNKKHSSRIENQINNAKVSQKQLDKQTKAFLQCYAQYLSASPETASMRPSTSASPPQDLVAEVEKLLQCGDMELSNNEEEEEILVNVRSADKKTLNPLFRRPRVRKDEDCDIVNIMDIIEDEESAEQTFNKK